ncbi:MAG TPA: glycosyltransferase family 39 protein [Terriglobales bacterium]|nr:glycosyltransferase family 39 protein [Terriglobales bacterium]
MVLIHSYRMKLDNDESAHIAASLASGQGFSNPFGGTTGPTAWLGPVYPFVLSGFFLLFGIGTRLSVIAALLFNSLLSSLTCVPVYFIARETFGERLARWSAWAWALVPYTIYWGIRWVWDTSLSALLFTCLFLFTLHLAKSSTARGWALYGLLWGVSGLTNTAELSFLPFAGCWICYRQFRQGKPFFRNATVGAVIFFATLMPWTLRNYLVFHKFMPVRGNFGVELHLGNTPDARGMWQVWLHPTQNVLEFRAYQQMGEAAYAQAKLHQATTFIREHPKHFAFLVFAHFCYYWAGPPHAERYPWLYEVKTSFFFASSVFAVWALIIALRQRLYAAELYLLLLLSYPAVYYITFAHPRYRHPIDAELLILIVFWCTQYHASRPVKRPPHAAS